MTRNDLKIQVFSKGIKQNELAREYGCTVQFVSRFFKGFENSKPFESFVLKKLAF
jgi:transcriptional regulator with XRE-family HTH domain